MPGLLCNSLEDNINNYNPIQAFSQVNVKISFFSFFQVVMVKSKTIYEWMQSVKNWIDHLAIGNQMFKREFLIVV
jgi:hypothetical protein